MVGQATEVEVLISIFYCMKWVCATFSRQVFCAALNAAMKMFLDTQLPTFGNLLALFLSLSAGNIYWLGDKFLLPSFSFGLRLRLHMALISCHQRPARPASRLGSPLGQKFSPCSDCGSNHIARRCGQPSGYVMHFYKTPATESVRHGLWLYSSTRLTAHNLTFDVGICDCLCACVCVCVCKLVCVCVFWHAPLAQWAVGKLCASKVF